MAADDLPDVTVSEFMGVRSLHLDSIWVQGSMRISKPLALELSYVQRMMAPLLWQEPATWRSAGVAASPWGRAGPASESESFSGVPERRAKRRPI